MTTDPATWVDAYGDRLYRYALSRVRDASAAEDLVAETLLTAFRSRERFQGASSELTWMTGILRNKVFELYRRQSREVPLLPSDEDADPESEFFDARHWKASAAPREWGGEPARKAETEEFSAALRKCLEALSAGVARAFVLREMEGASPDEAAAALGVTPGHLAVLLYRARMRLRRCLEKTLFAPGAA